MPPAHDRLVESLNMNKEHAAFGSVVATKADKYGDLSEPARSAANTAIDLIFQLTRSGYAEDTEVINDINHRFITDDYMTASSDLNGVLDDPLSADRPITSWIIHATPKDFITFARWNTERRADLQRRLDESTPELQQSTLARAKLLIDIDYMPKEALKLFLEVNKKYKRFRALDSFEAGARRVIAFQQSETSTIGISNVFSNPVEMKGINSYTESVIFHEAKHATGSVAGFTAGIHTVTPNPLAEEWEVSHATAISGDGRHAGKRQDIISPSKRKDTVPYGYDSVRELFAIILDRIPVELAGHAYYEKFGSDRYGRRADLEDQINRSLYRAISIGELSTRLFNNPSFVARERDINDAAAWLEKKRQSEPHPFQTTSPTRSSLYSLVKQIALSSASYRDIYK